MTFNEILNIKDSANIKPEFNYCGFVLYVPDIDQYVTSSTQGQFLTKRLYSNLPERANIYNNESQAYFDSLQIPHHCDIGVLFLSNDRYSLALLG